MAKQAAVVEVFKALGDPIRWEMVRQIGAVDELPCSTLEDTLPVTKPTISYHAKILTQAGLLDVRKDGRNSYYRLCRDVLEELEGSLSELIPGQYPSVVLSPVARSDGDRSVDREIDMRRTPLPHHPTSSGRELGDGPVLLTW